MIDKTIMDISVFRRFDIMQWFALLSTKDFIFQRYSELQVCSDLSQKSTTGITTGNTRM